MVILKTIGIVLLNSLKKTRLLLHNEETQALLIESLQKDMVVLRPIKILL